MCLGGGGGIRTLDLLGYEPDELPLLYSAICKGSNLSTTPFSLVR